MFSMPVSGSVATQGVCRDMSVCDCVQMNDRTLTCLVNRYKGIQIHPANSPIFTRRIEGFGSVREYFQLARPWRWLPLVFKMSPWSPFQAEGK